MGFYLKKRIQIYLFVKNLKIKKKNLNLDYIKDELFFIGQKKQLVINLIFPIIKIRKM